MNLKVCASLALLTIFISKPIFSLADVQCGDTITTAEILSQDISCDLETQVTIEGPSGSLDMNGYVLTCEDSDSAGISLEGLGAVLVGGTIDTCGISVFLEGDGFHSVQGLISDSPGVGFIVESDNNSINGSMFLSGGPGSIGFQLNGDFSRISGNSLSGNSDAIAGIVIAGSFSQVIQNTIDGSIFGIIIEPPSVNGLVIQNVISNSSDSGIMMDFDIVDPPSMNYIISGNQVTGSNGEGDLVDETPDACLSSNTWFGNIFDTASPSCLE
ncbi:NosD domain-containing protein [Microbulbifer sp. PAAF003]|uniref:NosD domain-containing protein n=1 Tax=Microbulbifer sp. PAAF003 TaxID=3243375 RepID=UPI0040397281